MKLILAILSLFMMLGCNMVHEWPGEEPVDPTNVDSEVIISCQVELDVEAIITKGVLYPEFTDEECQKYERKFYIEIYEQMSSGTEKVFDGLFFKELRDFSDLQFSAELHAKQYCFLIWMDYAKKEDHSDMFFSIENLTSIKILPKDRYLAGSDLKDAQTLLYPIDLRNSREWFRRIVIDLPLSRPVAKISFEATDIVEYASKMGCTENYDEFLKDYSLKFEYNGYLATGFNAVSQKLNDSDVGYHFGAVPTFIMESQNALLGFDYVFVNGESSSVNLSVEIVDKNGMTVNRVDNIVVPIYRGKQTIVRDKFFTREYNPGIGIDPGFDGEFNVYV